MHLAIPPYLERRKQNRNRSYTSYSTKTSWFSRTKEGGIARTVTEPWHAHESLASCDHATAGTGAARRSRPGDLAPTSAGRARVDRPRLTRKQALARPPLQPSFPWSLQRVPWSSPHARCPHIQSLGYPVRPGLVPVFFCVLRSVLRSVLGENTNHPKHYSKHYKTPFT
jgi:hypothetical protein